MKDNGFSNINNEADLDILKRFLFEDLFCDDPTSNSVISNNVSITATIIAKEAGVFAGAQEANLLAKIMGVNITKCIRDGEQFSKDAKLLELKGSAKSILALERTLINLISHMSGIATVTKNIVSRIHSAGLSTKIAATRKTLPGLRKFEKKAVIVGGGDPHRNNLSSMILIKDNHIQIVGNIKEALSRAKANSSFTQKIEIEVNTEHQAIEAAESGADIIMLDNMEPRDIKKTIDKLVKRMDREKIIIEASGGITSDNAIKYASTGVDVISLGSITNSAAPIDMSLELKKNKKVKKSKHN